MSRKSDLTHKAQKLKAALEKETGKLVQLRTKDTYLERQRTLAKARRATAKLGLTVQQYRARQKGTP